MSNNTYAPFEVAVPFKSLKDPLVVTAVNTPKSLPEMAPWRTVTAAARTLAESLASHAGDDAAVLDADHCVSITAAATSDFVPAKAGEQMLKSMVVGTSELSFVYVRAFILSIIPLLQPRSADKPHRLKRPTVLGQLDADGLPTAALRIEFETWEQLQEHVMKAVEQTLREGRDLRASILAHGVSDEIVAAVATIYIEESDQEFTALIARDGLTRLTNCFYTVFGKDASSAELPARVADLVLATAGTTSGPNGYTKARRKAAEETQAKLDAAVRSAAGDTSDPTLVRIAQATTVPVKVVSGMRQFKPASGPEAALLALPDALASLLNQLHNQHKPWDRTAQAANSIEQAIQQLSTEGALDPKVAAIAMGAADFDFDSQDQQGDSLVRMSDPLGQTPTGDVNLARAVMLQSVYCENFETIKKALRDVTSEQQIQRRRYADLYQSTITTPWNYYKPIAFSNSQKAWTAGGALPYSWYGKRWTPLAPKQYSDLVAAANDKSDPLHTDALATLQAAGGTAMIADGIFLAPSGSTEHGSSGREFERTQPQKIVELLSLTERGLWILAHAADSFDSHRQASASIPPAYPAAKVPDATELYKIMFPAVRPSDPIAMGRDDHVYDEVRLIAGLEKSSGAKPSAPKGPAETDAQKVSRLEAEILVKLRNLVGDLSALASLPVDQYAGDRQQLWHDTRDELDKVQSTLTGLKPSERDKEESTEFEGTEEDYDPDNDDLTGDDDATVS